MAHPSTSPAQDSTHIQVQGARENNLKNINLTIPRNAMVVFTGLSGSGKSSLAFDTIFAEGQRRYVESLSSYARMFLGQVDKPDVDFIEGLSPAVSIDQKSTSKNPRSTVGTITEIYDYMRLLWARIGQAHCPECHEKIAKQTPQDIVDQLLNQPQGTRLQVLAPVVTARKGEFTDLLQELSAQGYSRAKIDGKQTQLTEAPKLNKQYKHTIQVIIDRIVIKKTSQNRLTDSIETALNLADGKVQIEYVDQEEKSPQRIQNFSQHLACPNNHPIQTEEIEPRAFSFNSPFGACNACDGIGFTLQVDQDLIIPNPNLSLAQGAIAPWSQGKATSQYWLRLLAGLAEELKFDLNTPFNKLSKPVQKAILNGKDFQVTVSYRNRFGRERKYTSGFEGVYAYIKRKHEETESDWSKDRYEQYMRNIPCKSCQGNRLNPTILAVTLNNHSIADVTNLPIRQALTFIRSLTLSPRQQQIAELVLKEIDARLQFLLDVGLDYLTLSRPAATLSGGEAQRIRLATQIGSGLVGVLYVLDEPSIGLHQRDNRRLIETLTKLRDMGNTLIVVEHDEDTIKEADWIVDVGPGAGEHGGSIIHSGTYRELLKNTQSITGDYLAHRRTIPTPTQRRPINKKRRLKVTGARENNLKNIDVYFPLGTFTAVTGVSGSGKSTLVNEILYTALANKLNGAKQVPGRHTSIEGLDQLDKIIHVDQSPIGRTPRSNPATYTGVFDHIRKLFAETNEAKLRGYLPGRFSFNVKGGRCENCSGDGTLKIEMNFLPDVYVPCETCHGKRYNRETLEVKYKGKTIADVLEMPVEEAAEFFAAFSPIARHLNTLVDVGLGYIRLGQPATTLSGGEAQRVKLASELQKRSNGRSIYVLDEPTTGLHLEDIRKLLIVLNGLVDKGNTVISIEHNLDVIKSADWIIDLGPEGGDKGGTLLAEGTPEQIAAFKKSHTGTFLRELL